MECPTLVKSKALAMSHERLRCDSTCVATLKSRESISREVKTSASEELRSREIQKSSKQANEQALNTPHKFQYYHPSPRRTTRAISCFRGRKLSAKKKSNKSIIHLNESSSIFEDNGSYTSSIQYSRKNSTQAAKRSRNESLRAGLQRDRTTSKEFDFADVAVKQFRSVPRNVEELKQETAPLPQNEREEGLRQYLKELGDQEEEEGKLPVITKFGFQQSPYGQLVREDTVKNIRREELQKQFETSRRQWKYNGGMREFSRLLKIKANNSTERFVAKLHRTLDISNESVVRPFKRLQPKLPRII